MGYTLSTSQFPKNTWYVAALSKELTDKPLARTLLNNALVLFRTADGQVSALHNRCCHRALPLSMGTVEACGIRCGYHGLLYNGEGQCIEIPGQEKIPAKAKVKSFTVEENNGLVWLWHGDDNTPTQPCPEYTIHSHPDYRYDGDVYHYDAPYQLIHDNLLDLSHLGYVHLKTIGGNAKIHMNAKMEVESVGNTVTVKRYMPDSVPPPTYSLAYPFKGNINRWQEIEFHVSHLKIWTGGVDMDGEDVRDPERKGFHMRGFHGITPETDDTCHYFWTMATNPTRDHEEVTRVVVEQTKLTFDEDKVVIEAQYKNFKETGADGLVDIHVDTGANRARRIIDKLLNEAVPQ